MGENKVVRSLMEIRYEVYSYASGYEQYQIDIMCDPDDNLDELPMRPSILVYERNWGSESPKLLYVGHLRFKSAQQIRDEIFEIIGGMLKADTQKGFGALKGWNYIDNGGNRKIMSKHALYRTDFIDNWDITPEDREQVKKKHVADRNNLFEITKKAYLDNDCKFPFRHLFSEILSTYKNLSI